MWPGIAFITDLALFTGSITELGTQKSFSISDMRSHIQTATHAVSAGSFGRARVLHQ